MTVLLGRGNPLSLLQLQVAGFHFTGGLLILAGVIMAQTLTRPLARSLTSDKPSNAQQ